MTTIKLKKNSTSGSAPSSSDLAVGEVAVNTADGLIYTKHTDNSIKTIGGGQTNLITVTVAAVGGSNKFHLDGTSQQTITMAASGVYKFDQSHSSNASHPLRISSTSNGTHGGGSAITVDFVAVGTAGQAGAYVTFTIQQDGANTYYYYCSNHSGMGGSIAKLGSPTAAEILTSIKTVDGTGSGLDADTLGGIASADVARKVWASAGSANAGTENYWAKVATFSFGSEQYRDAQALYSFTTSNTGSADVGAITLVAIGVRKNNTSNSEANTLTVDILASANTTAFGDDSFKLIDSGGGTDVEFWVQKKVAYSTVATAWLLAHIKTSDVTKTYNNNATWQSATPTGSGLNVLSAGLRYNDYTVWHSGNDGTGSGLDADTLDGVEAAALLPLSGGTMTGNLALGDNVKATFGAGDLQIFHNASNSYISEEGTGDLLIRGSSNIYLAKSDGSETYARFEADGAASLYHNNLVKMATTASGININGNVVVSGTVDGVDLQTLNSAVTANTTKTTNATHSGEVTGSGALTITDNVVDEANLKVSNSPTNGYMLTAQSGDTGGLTWAAAPTGGTYTAGSGYGINLTGTEFRLADDRRRNSSTVDIYSGNTHDYTHYDADVGIRWYTANAEDMRLTDAGDLHVDGNVTAYSATVSDERLKTDIKPIENALDMLDHIGGYTFNYIKDNKASAGVIAQEVEKVLPSAVKDINGVFHGSHHETHKIVEYDQLIGVLIAAVKELKTEVEGLKNGSSN